MARALKIAVLFGVAVLLLSSAAALIGPVGPVELAVILVVSAVGTALVARRSTRT